MICNFRTLNKPRFASIRKRGINPNLASSRPMQWKRTYSYDIFNAFICIHMSFTILCTFRVALKDPFRFPSRRPTAPEVVTGLPRSWRPTSRPRHCFAPERGCTTRHFDKKTPVLHGYLPSFTLRPVLPSAGLIMYRQYQRYPADLWQHDQPQIVDPHNASYFWQNWTNPGSPMNLVNEVPPHCRLSATASDTVVHASLYVPSSQNGILSLHSHNVPSDMRCAQQVSPAYLPDY